TLRESLVDTFTAPCRFLTNSKSAIRNSKSQDLWALRHVSFEVQRGEVVGIIGRNGAGKSTLLKILSRITEPTEGRVEIHGRVGSLLEVGTGFHAELTGRENIYLNGAILGMKKAEIDRKFDEIVAFAEIEQFIDTPVKHYSSGMYVRLAFGVAAHLDPEILLVDEVLAVGDAQFQNKCIGKMSDVAKGGRTVLFVSHNMAAMQRLCTSALLMDKGAVVASGAPRTIAATYLGGEQRSTFIAGSRSGKPQVLAVDVRDVYGAPLNRPLTTEPFAIHIRYVLPEHTPGIRIGVGFLSPEGLPLFTSGARDAEVAVPVAAGEYEARVSLPGNVLLAGDFHLAVCIWSHGEIFDLREPALSFSVLPGASLLYQEGQQRKGFVHVQCGWSIESSPPAPLNEKARRERQNLGAPNPS
ncbi:MAG: ABC transporter ATP-binding protein, partial [Candidatus Binatia bacterium]